jgi:hypothetical protein
MEVEVENKGIVENKGVSVIIETPKIAKITGKGTSGSIKAPLILLKRTYII